MGLNGDTHPHKSDKQRGSSRLCGVKSRIKPISVKNDTDPTCFWVWTPSRFQTGDWHLPHCRSNRSSSMLQLSEVNLRVSPPHQRRLRSPRSPGSGLPTTKPQSVISTVQTVLPLQTVARGYMWLLHIIPPKVLQSCMSERHKARSAPTPSPSERGINVLRIMKDENE